MTSRLGRSYNSYYRSRSRLPSPDLSSNLSEETSCSSYSRGGDSSVYSWARDREDDRRARDREDDRYPDAAYRLGGKHLDRRSRYSATRSASPAHRDRDYARQGHYQAPQDTYYTTRSVSPTTSSVSNWSGPPTTTTRDYRDRHFSRAKSFNS